MRAARSLSGPFAAEVLGHFRPLVVNGLVERGPPLRLGLCVEIRATIDPKRDHVQVPHGSGGVAWRPLIGVLHSR